MNFNHSSVAEWSKAQPANLLIAGSNPSGIFFIFFAIFPNFMGKLPLWAKLGEVGTLPIFI